jgi:hypothetical protein
VTVRYEPESFVHRLAQVIDVGTTRSDLTTESPISLVP